MVQQKGRPPSKGPRTSSGRPIARAKGAYILFHRLREQALSLVKDVRILTELTLLSLRGELTDSQVSAGLKLAETYGKFERHKLKRRSAVSPAYQRAYGDPTAGEDELPVEALERLERRIKKDTKAWHNLQKVIDLQMSDPRRARELLERVCVENRRPLDSELNDLRYCLNIIATALAQGGRLQLPAIGVAVTARRPPRQAQQAKIRRERAALVDKAAWIDCTRQMLTVTGKGVVPSEKLLEELWRRYLDRKAFEFAKQDREGFRKTKERKRA